MVDKSKNRVTDMRKRGHGMQIGGWNLKHLK